MRREQPLPEVTRMTMVLQPERPVAAFWLNAGHAAMLPRQDETASEPAKTADDIEVQVDGGLLQARALARAHPDSPTAQARLAISEFGFGNRRCALDAARRVLGNDTFDAPALMVVAQIFVALGEIAEARQAADELLAAEASNIGARGAAAVLAARIAASEGDPHEALEFLSQSHSQAALALKGALLVKVGRYHDAIRVLREALSEVPDDPDALGALGCAYAAVGSIRKATRTMTAVAALDPTDRSVGLHLAALLFLQDRAADAGAVIDRLIGYHPHDIELEQAAAIAMHFGGDTAGALRRLRRAKTSRTARDATAAQREELGLRILLLDTPPTPRSELLSAAADALRRCDYRSADAARLLAYMAQTISDLPLLEAAYTELRQHHDRSTLLPVESKMAFLRLEFDRCTEASVEWAHREPFSIEAHVTATYMLAMHSGDYQQAAHLGRAGIRRGIQHDALCSNTAFALAMNGDPDKAARVLPDPAEHTPSLATAGLIEMVRGHHDRGIEMYEDCAHRLIDQGQPELADLVDAHRVLAEITVGRKVSEYRLADLADRAPSADPRHAIVWAAIAREQAHRANQAQRGPLMRTMPAGAASETG